MRESELDMKQWLRDTLEQQYETNSNTAKLLTDRNITLRNKIQQLDVETDDMVKSFKEQLTQAEYTALRKAMREKGTNDQIYFAICTTIHIRCKVNREQEHLVKLPRRHLLINTSHFYFHFYFFPYKYRIEKTLLLDGKLDSWFAWLLTMLMNEFKI